MNTIAKTNQNIVFAILIIIAPFLLTEEKSMFIMKKLKACPSLESCSKEWDETYKIQVNNE